jgi:hypothetical protein
MLGYRTSAVALLVAMLSAPCLGVCSGWMMSPHDRMACCADKSPDQATACCASGESRQNGDLFGGLALAALSVPAVDASQVESILTASQIFTPQWDSHDRIPSGSDRHVLLSVFLI